MYRDVGMANREKQLKQERDDIPFTHIAIPTSFFFFLLSLMMFMECVCVFCSQVVGGEGVSGRWQLVSEDVFVLHDYEFL